MLRFIIVALVTVLAVQAQEENYFTAERMAGLSDVGWLDARKEAMKRYNYILPKMVDACSDITTDSRAGGMLYVGHKAVKDAGAAGEENLLKYTENAYQIMRKLESAYRNAELPMKCSELFAMYTIARCEGQPPEKALKTVSEGIAALVNLLKK